MKPMPKPTKADRPKKSKPKSKGICPQCGFIFQGAEQHFPHCQREIKVKVFYKNKTKKQMYEAALYQLCRLIAEWRDGCTCVLADVDGKACSIVPNWGHVIPQGGSAFLVYEPSNWFRQCSAHNIIHDKVNPLIYTEWYAATWGRQALQMLKQAQIDNRNHGLNEMDLWNKLIELSDLYDLRHGFSSSSIAEKVEAGFYGTIIREAWIKEGRI